MTKMKQIHLLIGLPGSGKSYFANQEYEKGDALIVDGDKYIRPERKMTEVYEYITRETKSLMNYNSNIILDTLYLTNENIIYQINLLQKCIASSFEIILDIWNEDRNTCLINDKGRRTETSISMIQNGKFEEIDLEKIKQETHFCNILIVKHKVKKKPDWKEFADEYGEFSTGKLYSSRWILSSSSEYISSELPNDFEELDDLLEKVMPNITYLQYKKMKKQCVSIEEIDEFEYYVGTITYARYVCDLKKLYEFLNKI